MQVAESIDIKDIGETWRQTKILEETGEHVPRIPLGK